MLGSIGLFKSNAYGQETIFGVTNNNFLISWESNTPGTITFGVAISGLAQNEQILGIDFRPDDGLLYAVGSSNQLYTIDMSGVATPVGLGLGMPLNGSSFGYDFNPTIDLSRIDTNTNKNYVVDPDTGAMVQVTDLAFASGDPNFGVDPNVSHIGYTNSFSGASTTQLYAIDTGLDILTTQANSAGTLTTIGGLTFDINEVGGFDISGSSGLAYGAFQTTGSSNSGFYLVNLTTGAATFIGQIGGGTVITAMAIGPSVAIPEPTTALALVAIAPFVLLRRRNRK